jgi:hypothetical protein
MLHKDAEGKGRKWQETKRHTHRTKSTQKHRLTQNTPQAQDAAVGVRRRHE